MTRSEDVAFPTKYQSCLDADLADEGKNEDRVCGAGDLSERGSRSSWRDKDWPMCQASFEPLNLQQYDGSFLKSYSALQARMLGWSQVTKCSACPWDNWGEPTTTVREVPLRKNYFDFESKDKSWETLIALYLPVHCYMRGLFPTPT